MNLLFLSLTIVLLLPSNYDGFKALSTEDEHFKEIKKYFPDVRILKEKKDATDRILCGTRSAQVEMVYNYTCLVDFTRKGNGPCEPTYCDCF